MASRAETAAAVSRVASSGVGACADTVTIGSCAPEALASAGVPMVSRYGAVSYTHLTLPTILRV